MYLSASLLALILSGWVYIYCKAYRRATGDYQTSSQDEVQGLRCNSAAGCDSIRPKKRARASNALTLSGKVTACRGERQTFQRSASQN
ncbi:Uncharacterized protein HZ326_10323 [Fusarium oxysporum f. sp. albedinis]|nr:Uncharacterized protein HZ326_10323 [Fusarium oxysporum f. sp. albedinis]